MNFNRHNLIYSVSVGPKPFNHYIPLLGMLISSTFLLFHVMPFVPRNTTSNTWNQKHTRVWSLSNFSE